jgi:pyridoxal phosphate enzyme (YggS family)
MNLIRYREILSDLAHFPAAKLVAVSKTKPAEDIQALYDLGQRIFGENKVQEMTTKYESLPSDIQWHLIGHLQSNKVKYIAPYVSMIHAVDSLSLLEEIDRQAQKHSRRISCLLQIYIAQEDTKFGLSPDEARELLESDRYQALRHITISGLMGMATNTPDTAQIEREFASLKTTFDHFKSQYFVGNSDFCELSMGMSADYQIALRHDATLIRIGSDIFGSR